MKNRLRKKLKNHLFPISLTRLADLRKRKKEKHKPHRTVRYIIIPMGEEDGSQLERD
ncbi:hypothetical protein [Jeotgalibacillus proteolyticus]|uniref:hypothetical protein n=1 Tax=Jeotgalibacillus proteolyticus TaxID=2082395 RepID=UPI00142FC3E8|nr:hypothetical protein [Jeotgalibacillus proteolyticus]